MHHPFLSVAWRTALVIALSVSATGCALVVPQQAQRMTVPPTAAPATQSAQRPAEQGEAITRKTSEPYTGDLSIFENAEREKNLQIYRVMDILGIREGVSVADIGAGSGWFTVRAA